MEQQQDSQSDQGLEPLAIIGLAFEFPQDATSEDTFWDIIREGRSTGTEIPDHRLNIDSFYHPEGDRPGSFAVRGGHFLKSDIASFDAPFFSVNALEAACMDPQHRKLLETAYHALEDAGIPFEDCYGSNTSVYTGCFTNDYLSILQQDFLAEQRHSALGLSSSMLANRLSWFLNLKGTSMNIDTACSSSLIALHLACQDLRAGNSSMAFVGGANLVYHPNFLKIMSGFNFLSPDNRCWSFDKRANGYARGEGIAVLIIKRLSDAVRHGDTIRAVIRNTGSNQDGRTPGITQPSCKSQSDLIEKTFSQGGIDMADTRYFETHGTGTPAGDPVEARAIKEAFQKYRTPQEPLFVGAVKANIGHLEGCSGLAGIIKTILVLERGIVPPIANLETLNENIENEKQHLRFPTQSEPWPQGAVRRACVNSFAFGGTNAVVILDDAYHYLLQHGILGFHRSQDPVKNYILLQDSENTPVSLSKDIELEPSTAPLSPILLVWSASDDAGAEKLSGLYQEYLVQNSTICAEDLAYNLITKRSRFPWKNFAVITRAHNGEDRGHPPVWSKTPIKMMSEVRIAFAFTGQGSQYVGMGRTLSLFDTFQQSLSLSEGHLRSLGCPWSLMEILTDPLCEADVNKADISQPLITCLQIALVDLLESLEIRPSVVLGHSSGEIAAAYAAGVLSHTAAVKIAYYRGFYASELLKRTAENLGMTAVGLSRRSVETYLGRLERVDGFVGVSVGCVNSPMSVTLTGSLAQLAVLEAMLKSDDIFFRRLKVPVAYHSAFMQDVADEYQTSISGLESPKHREVTPMISSVTGRIIPRSELSKEKYWVNNLVSTVEFDAAFTTLLAYCGQTRHKKLGRGKERRSMATHVLEIGPHSALKGPIQEILQNSEDSTHLTYIPSLVRGQDASTAFLCAVGTIHCSGFPVNLLRANQIRKQILRPVLPGLPRYPFSNNKRYWKESRLSTNFRFQNVSRHDLFGVRSLDWNQDIAKWRNILRLKELPWIQDHIIDGEAVFPAAGYMVMAVEGLKQLQVNDGAEFSANGVHFKDIEFSHPIRFSEGIKEVETQMVFIKQQRGSVKANVWFEYRIYVIEKGSYIKCCRGLIEAISQDDERETQICSVSWDSEDWRTHIEKACPTSKIDCYNRNSSAIFYGPSFQNLSHLRVGENGEAFAILSTDSWLGPSKNQTISTPYSIHPATLDGLAQVMYPALSSQYPKLATMVPTRVQEAWINCSDAIANSNVLNVWSQSSLRGNRGGFANIVGSRNRHESPLIYLKGLETTFIGKNVPALENDDSLGDFFMTKTWRPDLELLDRESLLSLCLQDRPPQDDNEADFTRTMALAIMSFIKETLRHLDKSANIDSLKPHFKTYVRWMRFQEQRLRNGQMIVQEVDVQEILADNLARDKLINGIANRRADFFLFIQIGLSLVDILSGQIDPLQFVHDGTVERAYDEIMGNLHHSYPASVYIEILAFKKPSMRVLEVGAGGGSQTTSILETLSSNGVNNWEQYVYTDVSSAFFPRAKSKFAKYLPNLRFQVFDVSRDPEEQSLETGSFDLVVASHVLHATDFIGESLGNIRKLLRPNGKLLLFETTVPETIMAFAFGLFKGWWSPLDHETRSHLSPCLSSAQWDYELKQTGFTGVDIEIPGQEKVETRVSSIIVSTARENVLYQKSRSACEVTLVVNELSHVQVEAAKAVKSKLEMDSHDSRELQQIISLEHFARTRSKKPCFVIFLLELDDTFLSKMNKSDFEALQSVLLRSSGVIWVTSGISDTQSQFCNGSADGLGRVLMAENSDFQFVTLSINDCQENSSATASIIYELTKRTISSPNESVETEYRVLADQVHISRILKHESLSPALFNSSSEREQLDISPYTNEFAIELQAKWSEQRNRLDWVEEEVAAATSGSVPGADEVIIEVRAVGLTTLETLDQQKYQCYGESVMEYAGIVQSAGDKTGFGRGDRVCLIAKSTLKPVLCVKSENVALIPGDMSFTEASAVLIPIWTAYYTIVHLLRLRNGQSVLVHNSATLQGQLMVYLAKTFGLQIIATVQSESESDFVSHSINGKGIIVFHKPGGALQRKVMTATGGLGVNTVVGSFTTGQEFSDLLPCLAPFGQFVSIASPSHPNADMQPFVAVSPALPSNISQMYLDVMSYFDERPSRGFEIFRESMKLELNGESYWAPLIRVISAQDVSQIAIEPKKALMENRKTVLSFDPDKTIRVIRKPKSRCNFQPDATYIIAGGLGGLGRKITRWMVKHGARNLILLSRSGGDAPVASALLEDMRAEGARIETPAVDIRDYNCLQTTLTNLLGSGLPPIRGCIQATMALRDVLFVDMTYEDWLAGAGAKVAGSWNLHAVLPANLDFFILLSSLSGITGGRGQANYAAGNSFQDALAEYRLKIGQKALSIDLGLMIEDGIVAESPRLLALSKKIAYYMPIKTEELLIVLGHYCNSNLPVPGPHEAQLLFGLEKFGTIVAKGNTIHDSLKRPTFRHLFNMGRSNGIDTTQNNESLPLKADQKAIIAAARSEEEVVELVIKWLRGRMSHMSGFSADDIDIGRPMHLYGLDSLLAIDLKDCMQHELGLKTEVLTLLGSDSLKQVATQAAKSRPSGSKDESNAL